MASHRLQSCLATLAPVALLLGAGLACAKAEPTRPVPTAEIAYTIDSREAYARVLRAIVDSDLSVELKDVDGGIVQTEWHLSGRKVVGLGSTVERRVRFKIIVEGGSCRVKPQADQRVQLMASDPFGPWQAAGEFTDPEEKVHQALVQSLKAQLAKGTSTSAVETPPPQVTPASAVTTPKPETPSGTNEPCVAATPCKVETYLASELTIEIGKKYNVRLKSGDIVNGTVTAARRMEIVLDQGAKGSRTLTAAEISDMTLR